jgi:hypothetical protein
MAILSFPNITPESFDFGIKYNTQVSTTTLSGITQTVELPGARWTGSMSFRDLTPADSADLKAFLLKLRGSSGRFYLGDLAHTEPFNSVSGTATIQAGSGPRILTITGQTGNFSVGDYLQIDNDDNRELKMVVGVSGNDYTIEPLMRRTDYIGSTVYYSSPNGVFLLTTDDSAKWAVRSKAKLSDISFGFVEGY